MFKNLKWCCKSALVTYLVAKLHVKSAKSSYLCETIKELITLAVMAIFGGELSINGSHCDRCHFVLLEA